MLRQLGLLVVMIFIATASFGQEAQEAAEDVIKTDNINTSTVDSTSTSTTTVKSPPPSAIAPSINSANSDLCTVGISGAVQTQILGISAGKTVREFARILKLQLEEKTNNTSNPTDNITR